MAKGTIIVTGANGGLGSAIAEQILSSPQYAEHHIIFTVRNVAKASVLNGVIAKYAKKSSSPHKHEVVALDLASLASGRSVADAINARVSSGDLPPIRALILNAGYQEWATQSFTNDGFDMTFQANYLTHWLLTVKLLQSVDKQEGRIVVLGSWSHDPHDERNGSMGAFTEEKWMTAFPSAEALAKGKYSTPKDDPAPVAGFRRYGACKLCEIMMIYELQSRLDSDPALSNISVVGVDPGGMGTGLVRRGSPVLNFILQYIFPAAAVVTTWWSPNGMFRTTAKSARDVMRAAFDVKTLGQHPKAIYLNGTDPEKGTSAEARDERKRKDLWESSVEFAGLKEGETVLKRWR